MLKTVASLYVQCSMRVRNFDAPALAMSDCCQKPATSAVVMENGNKMWRCHEHRGMRYIERGPVVTMIEVKEKP